MCYRRTYPMAVWLLGIALISGLWIWCGQEVRAAEGDIPITLQQIQNLAIAKSRQYKTVQNKIELQQVKYSAAVKSIRMKQINMATFRWTPLLSFKFPEKPGLVDEYEWQYKPVQISSAITLLKHELTDIKMEVKEEAANLYVEAYVCQEKITYTQRRLTEQETVQQKNQIKIKSGEAKQADLDKIKKSIEKLNTELALQMRTLQTKKEKLSQFIKLDITTGYYFLNPFVQADIPRSALNSIITYTLDKDQSFYESKMNTSLSAISITLLYDFMQYQYGSKMNYIQSFVRQAQRGEEVDGSAFKSQYNVMLNEVDRPWNGSINLIFFKIYREWFKGAKSGSRYVEDDPYALYTATLEYADALREQEQAERELRNTVSSGFESLITAKNAYENLKKSNEELNVELRKSTELNRMGRFAYEDLKVLQEEYEEYQMEELESLSIYSQLLYSYDRLTCGAVSAYLQGEELFTEVAAGGESYLEAEELDGAYYYIESQIADNLFLFGVSIPEDFSIEITDFELHVDGVRIGEKTKINQVLRHLTLDLEQVEKVQVYLYKEDELMDVCEINSAINRAPLQIVGGYRVIRKEDTRTVAAFSYEVNETTGSAELLIQKKEGEDIAYYRLADSKGQPLYSEELIPIAESFHYLSILTNDFSQVKIQCYDRNKILLYVGECNEQTLNITVHEAE